MVSARALLLLALLLALSCPGCDGQACAPGRFASGAGSCEECAPGQYQDQVAQAQCKVCPAGTFTPSGGQRLCGACSDAGECGSWCGAGSGSQLQV